MKKYMNPQIEVERIEAQDILTVSGNGENVVRLDFGGDEFTVKGN